MSLTDEYESVAIDQMTGNHVSGRVFERTILCLNARRETRVLSSLTNQSVVLLTNITVNFLTNYTVSVITNQSRTLATNQLATPTPAAAGLTATNETAGTETNLVAAPPGPPGPTTNTVATTARNLTLSKAGNQVVTTENSQTQTTRQVTVTTNHLSITTADNQAVTAETNQITTTVTNLVVTPVTNHIVIRTNLLLRDYYLDIEFTPPPDFALQSGESLVLLVDGARHSFAATNSASALPSRRGFVSALYKVPRELLESIADAKEVKVRLKGSNAVIDKQMNRASRERLKQFVVKRLVSDLAPPPNQSNTRLFEPAAEMALKKRIE